MNTNINGNSKAKNSNNNVEKLKKKYQEYYTAIQEYLNNGLGDRYDDLIKLGNLDDYFNEFLGFLKTNSNYNKKEFIDGINSSKNKIAVLVKREYIKKVMPFINYHNIITTRFKDEFKLSSKQTIELEEALKDVKLSSLKNLCYSQNARFLFLKNNTSIKNEKLETVENKDEILLKKIFPKKVELQQKIFNNKELKESILRIIKNNEKVLEDDIDNLLNTFSLSEKKAFIKYFLPEISINKALELGFITDKELESEVLKIFNFSNNQLDKKEKKELLGDDELLSSIFIKTDTKKIDSKNIDDIIKYAKNTLLSELDEVREANISDKNEINKLPFSKIKDLIVGDEKISSEIRNNIDKLISGNYIVYEGNGTKQIFKINALESGTDNNIISYTNVTTNNGFTEEKLGKTINSTYSDFLDFLRHDNGDKNTRKAEIKITTKTSLENDENLLEIKSEENIETIQDLENFLDDFDYKNKGLKLIDTGFYAKTDNGGQDLFTIDSLGDDYLQLSSGEIYRKGNNNGFTFEAFCTTFKSKECSRIKKIKDENELVDRLSKEEKHKDNFKDVKVVDGKLLTSNLDEKKAKKGIEFLIGDGDKGSYRITEIKNGRIKFQKGKFEEEDNKKEKNNKKEFKGSEKWNLSLTEFFEEIKNKQLKPESNDKKIVDKSEKFEDFKRKKGLFKSYMGWLSIAEMSMGMKQIGQSIKDRLENGNKLKSAKFALSMGKFLTKELQEDLQSQVEGEEKKTMEQLMESLKRLDSSIMIPKIERILKNKGSQQYEIEAAMMSILKDGTLYPKKLSKHRGTYAWYKALGGTPGDALYFETKAKCEATNKTEDGSIPKPIPFTEEILVEALLSEQAKGNIKPKRRSKIHKEFGDYLKKGLNAELEDGAEKAGDFFTLNGRIDYSIKELNNGGYANGIGAIEKIWAKGGAPKEMHAIPFVIAVTGITQNFPQSLLGKIVAMGWGSPYSELVFSKDKDSIKLYKDAIKIVIKSIFSNHKDVIKEFDNIGDSVDKSYKFWNKYGDKLINRINLQDPYIFSKVKVKDENMSNEDRNTLIDYYGFITGIHKEKDFAAAKQEDLEMGLYDYKNNSIVLISLKKHVQNYMSVVETGSFRNPGAAEPILNSALELLEDVHSNNEMTKEEKYEVFYEIQSSLEPFLIKAFGQYGGADPVTKGGKKSAWSVSTELSKLKRYGINIKDKPFEATDEDKASNPKETIYSYIESDKYKKHVEENFDRFLNMDISSNSNEGVQEKVETVKLSIKDILEKNTEPEEN